MSAYEHTKLLHAATLQLGNQRTLTELLQQIVEIAQEQIGTRYAAISLPDWGENGFTFVHSGISAETVAALPHTPHHLGLLGRVLDQSQPVIISDIADDPELVGFPDAHPMMSRFIGVAIHNGSDPVGALYLTDKLDRAPFNEADEQLVELFASHAAVAIEQYQLRLQARQLAALQVQHSASVALHDSAIQSLFAASLTLHSLADEVGEKSTSAQTLIATSLGDITRIIDALRHFITEALTNGF